MRADGEHGPLSIDSLEGVLSSIREDEIGADHQVTNRPTGLGVPPGNCSQAALVQLCSARSSMNISTNSLTIRGRAESCSGRWS